MFIDDLLKPAAQRYQVDDRKQPSLGPSGSIDVVVASPVLHYMRIGDPAPRSFIAI
jgi:hypothetical protein